MPNERAINEGQVARLVRSHVEDFAFDKERNIITNLIKHYRGDTLTNDRLRGGIGEIAGLRSFVEYLETKVRQGEAELEKSMENSK